MDLNEFKIYMKEQAEFDRSKQETQVAGSTLKNALSNAAMELGLPIRMINYEILQKGSSGVLGIGKKDWLIIAYVASDTKKSASASDDLLDPLGMSSVEIVEDKDAAYYIRLNRGVAKLMVVPSKGTGRDVKQKTIEDALIMRGIEDFQKNKIKAIIQKSDEKYHNIGTYRANPPADALVDITLSNEDMLATMIFTPPGHRGDDIEFDLIASYLKQQGIIYGVQEDKIKEFIQYPNYSNTLDVAVGDKAENGTDAYVEYLFETDKKRLVLEEVDGRVDFKNMKMIQNVKKGDVLAIKHDFTEGKDGSTVLGRMLPARPGKDINFDSGDNTRIEGDKIISTMDGQVFLSSNKVTVDPVYVVKGDVNLKSGGNIDFLGTVIIKGSVEDGLSVKATKNIEIAGTVGKCNISAGGDIMVSQGINGRDGGNVESSGSIYAKFIENAHVKATEDVIVHDGIVNSEVDANGMVKCYAGKRAAIVGGTTRAAKGVIAKTLGTIAGSETIVEVGFDPEKRERFLELEEIMEQVKTELSDVELNISTLVKTQDKSGLNEERKESLNNLRLRKDELLVSLSNSTEEYNSIKEYLNSLKFGAEISVEGMIFSGVKVNICGAEMRVRNEMKLVTLYREGPVVKMKVFQKIKR